MALKRQGCVSLRHKLLLRTLKKVRMNLTSNTIIIKCRTTIKCHDQVLLMSFAVAFGTMKITDIDEPIENLIVGAAMQTYVGNDRGLTKA